MSLRMFRVLAAGLLGVPLLALGATDEPIYAAPPLWQVADNGDGLSQPRDALFGTAPEQPAVDPAATTHDNSLPASKQGLFDMVSNTEVGPAGDMPPTSRRSGLVDLQGFFQTELAYTYSDPAHWSKEEGRLELGNHGLLGQGMQWKLSGRLDYNAVYEQGNFYQQGVRDIQKAEFQLRETYLDLAAAGLDWRLGRQQIVWGEMVGLFFADVVSAKDLREFVLPDFQVLRIPQWAARAEYFKSDFHAEMIWIPFPSYDRIGRPKDFSQSGSGSDFYPYPPALAPVIRDEVKPSASPNHGNFGIRVSQLTNGWDMSGFYYTSMAGSPTFYRDPVVSPVLTFTPRHDRIWQLGGTLGKDLDDVVLKAEAVYSSGRRFNLVTDMTDADGVVRQNTLDWAVGLDFNPSSDTRVNTQLFQRYFFEHNPDIIPAKTENGFTLLVSHNFPDNWKTEVLLVRSLNRSDWMLRPKASWGFQPNWKLTLGIDAFHGPSTGLFGQYDAQNRAYTEIRRDF